MNAVTAQVATLPQSHLEHLNESHQSDDSRIVDYRLTLLEGTRWKIRGALDPSKPFGVVVGAVQTFGRYVERPFAELLSSQAGMQVLNLGFSGAGPGFFLQRPELLRWINRAEFAVVQAFSGRSLANFAFESGSNDGFVTAREGGENLSVESAYRNLLQKGEPSLVIALRAANRARWLREMTELFRRISVPKKCLLWFSKRRPNYIESIESLEKYWAGDAPHLVTRPMLNELADAAGVDCVEVISRDGLPHLVKDLKSDKPVEIWPMKDFPAVKLRCHNHVYPSPEMHQKCATAINDWLAIKAPESAASFAIPQASAQRRIIVHHHIFKNAGSSIDRALVDVLGKRWRAFDPQIFLSDDEDRIDGSRSRDEINSNELEVFLDQNPDVDAVSTHQGRSRFKLDSDYQKLEISLIRDPIGRALSIWKYERRPDRQATYDSQLSKQAAQLSFDDFVKWCLLVRRPPLAPLSNFQVRTLSGMPKWEGRVAYSDLDRAMEYVTRVGCVGIVERFDHALELLNQRIDAFIPGIQLRNYHVNASAVAKRSGDEEARALLTKANYELLLEANAMDLALYNHVLRMGAY